MHDFYLEEQFAQDLTSSVLMAQIRKAPHVAKPDAESHLGQKILDLAVPPGPRSRLRGALLAVLTSQAKELRLRAHRLVIVIAGQWLLFHLRQGQSEQTKKKGQNVDRITCTQSYS